MPTFESSQVLPRPPEELFAFFSRPAHLLAVSPPEWHLVLAEAPDELGPGARLVVRGRRWGLPQRAVSEVVEFVPPRRFVEEQRQGPLRRFRHAHEFEAVEAGTRVVDRIDFEPPGGILGLTVTATLVLRELEWLFAHRRRCLEELFRN